MLEMHSLRKEELPQVKALWQTVFGDSEAFVDRFLKEYSDPGEVFVLTEGEEVMTMLALLPLTFRWEDGREEPLPYVYALATRPGQRGKGYARLLLRYADYQASMRWARGISTVPAEEGLHPYFASEGYRECFTTRTGTWEAASLPAPAPGDSVAPVGAAEYGRLREGRLAGTAHVSYPDQLLDFQRAMCRDSGGELYALQVCGEVGCAAVERLGAEEVLFKELLVPAGTEEAALALVARALPAGRYHLRTPAGEGFWPGGKAWAFGMAKHLGEGKRPPFAPEGCYLGLAFD